MSVALIAVLALGAATLPPASARLTAPQRRDLRCAAAFAVVAGAQARGEPAALALPPLAERGRRYLGLVGEQVAAATGLSGATVHGLLRDEARALGDRTALAVATACLADLDGAVPRRADPDAVECQALLEVYADVLARREGGSALAATLRREAELLALAAQALARARTGNPLETARQRVRAAITGQAATLDAETYAQCRKQADTHG